MTLIIRADATTRMGTGHLMRCLALAQVWQAKEGEIIFVTSCANPGLLQRLNDEGMTIVDLPAAHPDPGDWECTRAVLTKHPRARVVLDGYHFTPDYQKQVRSTGHPLLIIDDTAHLDVYHADILLNQNIGAEKFVYQTDSDTRLLLGTQYALLRREFWPWRGWQRQTPAIARKVLVTLGGGDPDNQTLKVIRALQQLKVDKLEVMVVVGSSNPHRASLEAAISAGTTHIQLVQNVTNMPELMAWADVAVSAGGSTCWELAFMGLPTLILVIADNQTLIAKKLEAASVALNLGWHTTVASDEIASMLNMLAVQDEKLRKMSLRGQNLVDGIGGNRIVQMLKNGSERGSNEDFLYGK